MLNPPYLILADAIYGTYYVLDVYYAAYKARETTHKSK